MRGRGVCVLRSARWSEARSLSPGIAEVSWWQEGWDWQTQSSLEAVASNPGELFSRQPFRGIERIPSALWIRKRKLREVKKPTQGHSVCWRLVFEPSDSSSGLQLTVSGKHRP